uniref:E1-fs protein n=1 Tax=Glycine max TaxID=3847 RepID=T2HGG6_SOYBN|nr:e1-fs protein [Glycine max]
MSNPSDEREQCQKKRNPPYAKPLTLGHQGEDSAATTKMKRR